MDVISYSLAAKQANRISNLFINSETEPAIPVLGQEWYVPSTGKTYKRIDDNGNHIWVDAGSAAGNAAIKKSEAFVAGTASGIYDGNSLSDFPVKLGYSIGYVDVYLNGRLLDKSDYVAVDGSVVALDDEATDGDIVYIQAFGTFIVADHYTKSEVDVSLAEKALLGGSATQLFKIADAVNDDEAVNKGQLGLVDNKIVTKLGSNGTSIVKTDSSAIKNQCTAWVVYDGTDGTIFDSFNVTSVTRESEGNCDITFDTVMDNANYMCVASCGYDSGDNFREETIGDRATDKVRVQTFYGDITWSDAIQVSVAIFGGKN